MTQSPVCMYCKRTYFQLHCSIYKRAKPPLTIHTRKSQALLILVLLPWDKRRCKALQVFCIVILYCSVLSDVICSVDTVPAAPTDLSESFKHDNFVQIDWTNPNETSHGVITEFEVGYVKDKTECMRFDVNGYDCTETVSTRSKIMLLQ